MKTRRTLVTKRVHDPEGGRSFSSGGMQRLATRGESSEVGRFGIARLRPSRAAYAEHAAEAAPPALRRAPSTAADVRVVAFSLDFHFEPPDDHRTREYPRTELYRDARHISANREQ